MWEKEGLRKREFPKKTELDYQNITTSQCFDCKLPPSSSLACEREPRVTVTRFNSVSPFPLLTYSSCYNYHSKNTTGRMAKEKSEDVMCTHPYADSHSYSSQLPCDTGTVNALGSFLIPNHLRRRARSLHSLALADISTLLAFPLAHLPAGSG